MSETKRPYREMLNLVLPDDALSLAIEIATLPENAHVYEKDETGKELRTDRQKGLCYLRVSVVDSAVQEWVDKTKAGKAESERTAKIEQIKKTRVALEREIVKGDAELAELEG